MNVKKCMCWYLSIIELKNAWWNIEKHDSVQAQSADPLISLLNLKVVLCLIKHQATKEYGWVGHNSMRILTLILEKFICQPHAPAALPPGKKAPVTHWI